MQVKIFSFLKIFLPFSIILFLTQFILVNHVLEKELFFSTLSIYVFHGIATLLIFILLAYVSKTFSDKTGFAFMACSLFKMLAAVLFLLPMMLNDVAHPFQDLIAFFIPYFLFLIFETVSVVKLINTK